VDNLRQDIRIALRHLVRAPGFCLVTVLTLALGIGANTAIFSVVHGVLLRPLPYGAGDRLVRLGADPSTPADNGISFSVQELLDYRRQSRTLAGLEEFHSMTFTLLGRGEPDRVQAGIVSSGFFDVLGIRAQLGRTFGAGEDRPGAEAVLLLSNSYWQRRFGGDPGIVGARMVFDDQVVTVVGVLPPLPQYPQEQDVFVPIQACSVRSSQMVVESRGFRLLTLIGRLRPGVSLSRAQAEIDTISARLRAAHAESYPRDRGSHVPVTLIEEELTRSFRPTLLVLAATAALVLLVACVNVVNLNLARLLRRRQEVTVRAALGAGRARLIWQLLLESVLLSLAGGGLGLALAYAGRNLLVAFAGRFTPRGPEVTLDGWVLLFTLIVSLLSAVVCGFVPALQASRHDLAAALNSEGYRASLGLPGRRLRGLLVVAQVAASFTLLIGAGLTLRSLLKLQHVDVGFDAENVLTATVTLPSSVDNPGIVAFLDQLLERLRSNPAFVSAGLTNDMPLEDQGHSQPVHVEGRPEGGEDVPRARMGIASEGFFKTLKIPLLHGRAFDPGDRRDAPPVVIVNDAFARRFWPGESAVGKRVRFGSRRDWLTIVGVVGDVRQVRLDTDAVPGFYRPLRQMTGPEMRLFVRTASDPARFVPEIVRIVHELDPKVPVSEVRTLAQVLAGSSAPARLTALLLALFALVASMIAVLGIGGLLSMSVSERTREIGIRFALGARRRRVLTMVLGEGMLLVSIGLGIGIAGSLWLSRLLSGLLFGIVPNDPLTFVAASVLLLASAGLACFVPARQALNIDPLLALRYE
jgi:predicted permease